MTLWEFLTRSPGKSVMDPSYVSETDASQPWRGLLQAVMERTVDVPAAAINSATPMGMLMRMAGTKVPVPSEQAAFTKGGGPGYEFGRSLPDAALSALLLGNPAPSAGRRAPANQMGAITLPKGADSQQPIKAAVVQIGDKYFYGRTHGDAINKAIYEGVLSRGQNGKINWPKDLAVNSDLFLTADNRLVDRLGASAKWDVGASETAIERGMLKPTPAGSFTQEEMFASRKSSALPAPAAINAMLDPASRDSADILAGIAGTSLLSPLLLRYLTNSEPMQ